MIVKLQSVLLVALIALVCVVGACCIDLERYLKTTLSQITLQSQAIPTIVIHTNEATDAATKLITAATPAVKSLSQTAVKINKVVDGLAETENKLNATIDLTNHRVNDLCPDAKTVDAAIHPCGTLADLNRTLATTRGTAGVVEKAVLTFDFHENDLFEQEKDAYTEVEQSMNDFEKLVSDPDLFKIITNLSGITLSTDGILQTSNKILTKESQCLLHPTIWCETKAWMLPSAQITGAILR